MNTLDNYLPPSKSLQHMRYQYKIPNAVPKPSQQLTQAPVAAMALSVEEIVGIVTLFVGFPSAIMIIWNLVVLNYSLGAAPSLAIAELLWTPKAIHSQWSACCWSNLSSGQIRQGCVLVGRRLRLNPRDVAARVLWKWS